MDILSFVLTYIIPFLFVLGALVFVHEWGHYWVARRNGVRIEVFSIGFGPELFGWTDRAGTRWKVSAVPLGGYVKMFGDVDAASAPSQALTHMTPQEQAVSFHHKRLGQRAAIVVAGPVANFLFAFVVLVGLFMIAGHPLPPPAVGTVLPDSAAAAAGLQPGDEIRAVNGQPVARFAEFSALVQASQGEPLTLTLVREGTTRTLVVTPRPVVETTAAGDRVELFRIGVGAVQGVDNPVQALRLAADETVLVSWTTLAAVGQMIVGERGTEELGGPLRIAQISGDAAQLGAAWLFWFMAVLSINLGLINLFPVPLLDGGHLLFYAIEAIKGRPLGQRAQEYGFRIGLALVLMLMLFATWNDLIHLQVVAFIRDFIS